MKSKGWLFAISLSAMSLNVCAEQWIRINQLGYLPQSRKVAVFMSEEKIEIKEYALIDAFTGKVARTFATPLAKGKNGKMESTYRLDFSDFESRDNSISPLQYRSGRLQWNCRFFAELYASAKMRL